MLSESITSMSMPFILSNSIIIFPIAPGFAAYFGIIMAKSMSLGSAFPFTELPNTMMSFSSGYFFKAFLEISFNSSKPGNCFDAIFQLLAVLHCVFCPVSAPVYDMDFPEYCIYVRIKAICFFKALLQAFNDDVFCMEQKIIDQVHHCLVMQLNSVSVPSLCLFA